MHRKCVEIFFFFLFLSSTGSWTKLFWDIPTDVKLEEAKLIKLFYYHKAKEIDKIALKKRYSHVLKINEGI